MQTVGTVMLYLGWIVASISAIIAICWTVVFIKDCITNIIRENSSKSYRIDYTELFNKNIEKEGVFGTAFIRVCERKYEIVVAKNVVQAMYKFNKQISRRYFYFPSYAILSVTEQPIVK